MQKIITSTVIIFPYTQPYTKCKERQKEKARSTEQTSWNCNDSLHLVSTEIHGIRKATRSGDKKHALFQTVIHHNQMKSINNKDKRTLSNHTSKPILNSLVHDNNKKRSKFLKQILNNSHTQKLGEAAIFGSNLTLLYFRYTITY